MSIINKALYICTMKSYSAFKRIEILTHAVIWMNLENINIMLSEISQTQKANYYMILLV